eukprot:15445827-Alexandrium_andersonii.AAC.1
MQNKRLLETRGGDLRQSQSRLALLWIVAALRLPPSDTCDEGTRSARRAEATTAASWQLRL